jgi:hypothetical protein
MQLSRVLDLVGHHPEAVRARDEGLKISNDRAAAEQAARSLSVDRF